MSEAHLMALWLMRDSISLRSKIEMIIKGNNGTFSYYGNISKYVNVCSMTMLSNKYYITRNYGPISMKFSGEVGNYLVKNYLINVIVFKHFYRLENGANFHNLYILFALIFSSKVLL